MEASRTDETAGGAAHQSSLQNSNQTDAGEQRDRHKLCGCRCRGMRSRQLTAHS